MIEEDEADYGQLIRALPSRLIRFPATIFGTLLRRRWRLARLGRCRARGLYRARLLDGPLKGALLRSVELLTGLLDLPRLLDRPRLELLLLGRPRLLNRPRLELPRLLDGSRLFDLPRLLHGPRLELPRLLERPRLLD